MELIAYFATSTKVWEPFRKGKDWAVGKKHWRAGVALENVDMGWLVLGFTVADLIQIKIFSRSSYSQVISPVTAPVPRSMLYGLN